VNLAPFILNPILSNLLLEWHEHFWPKHVQLWATQGDKFKLRNAAHIHYEYSPRKIMTANLPSPDLAFSDTASQPDDQPVAIPKTSAASQPINDIKPNGYAHEPQMSPSEPEALERPEKTGLDARTKISNLLKDKEQEWAAVMEKKGPLQLLDLPMDILKEIVKEVADYTHRGICDHC
jgi:hypothetical protein